MKCPKLVISITCAFALAVAAVCAAPGGVVPCGAGQAVAAVKAPTKAQYKRFKKASGEFSMELFSASVAKNGKKNTVVAPMSVLTALTLMANGADGKTRTEMRRELAGGMKVKVLDRCLRKFNNKLVNTKNAKVVSANAIWYDSDGSIVLKPAFAKANRTFFKAKIKGADFDDAATVKQINAWVSDKTEKMIPGVIDSLPDDAKSVLVNTLYLNAKWANPYDKDQVVKKKFTNAKGVKKKVEMLCGSEYSYISGNGATGFIKPYKKGYSFVALLPEEGTTLKKFVKQLDAAALAKLVKGATNEKVITTMPKLDLSYSDKKLAILLAKMGFERSTSELKANFKKMATLKSGKLYIGDVVHKTRLKLDEEGTEAAAATAVMLKASSAYIKEKPKVVTLNRPYVFAIIDNNSKLPLFMGAVNNVK